MSHATFEGCQLDVQMQTLATLITHVNSNCNNFSIMSMSIGSHSFECIKSYNFSNLQWPWWCSSPSFCTRTSYRIPSLSTMKLAGHSSPPSNFIRVLPNEHATMQSLTNVTPSLAFENNSLMCNLIHTRSTNSSSYFQWTIVHSFTSHLLCFI